MENKDHIKENTADMPASGPEQALALSDISGHSLASLLHTGSGLDTSFTKDIYIARYMIVGTRYVGGSQDLVEALHEGTRISFLRERENPYDPKAIMALDPEGRKLGYIPRRDNALMSALMDAGKQFYGIIPPKDPGENADSTEAGAARPRRPEDVPSAISVDLYMRESIGTERMSRIPRQGSRGSFRIRQIFAIKIINGEERGMFRKQTEEPPDPTEYHDMLAAFREFAGVLPVVGHGILGDRLSTLEEAYGVHMGSPFSAHVIDTRVMAENHFRGRESYDLGTVCEDLGLRCSAEDEGEKRCRLTLLLYRRMEQSGQEFLERTCRMFPELLESLGLRKVTLQRLQAAGIDTVRELWVRTEGELRAIPVIWRNDV